MVQETGERERERVVLTRILYITVEYQLLSGGAGYGGRKVKACVTVYRTVLLLSPIVTEHRNSEI